MSTTTDYRPVAAQGRGIAAAKPQSTAAFLKAITPELGRALPKGMDADRMARIVMTEIRKSRNAKAAGIAKHSLDECTQESFAGALLTASALGLEPGIQSECYLVPYRDNRRRVVDCQLILGYQGIVKLFWQHPLAENIRAEIVYARDKFKHTKGLKPRLIHEPADGDRGAIIGYYAIVKVKGREPLWDYFTADQIKTLRRGKVGSSGDIPDPEHWMERKTAIRQVLKLAPKTTRLDQAVRLDESSGSELYQNQGMSVPAITAGPGAGDAEYVDGEVIEDLPDLPAQQPADEEPPAPEPPAEEDVPPAPEPPADDQPPAAPQQDPVRVNAIGKLFAEADCTDGEDQRIVVCSILNREIASVTQLDDIDLKTVHDTLTGWKRRKRLADGVTDALQRYSAAQPDPEPPAEPEQPELPADEAQAGDGA